MFPGSESCEASACCRRSRDMRSNATCRAHPAKIVNRTIAAIKVSDCSIRCSNDLVLQLHLFAPTDVERHQLLLCSKPVVERCSGCSVALSCAAVRQPGRNSTLRPLCVLLQWLRLLGFRLKPCMIRRERSDIGPGQLLCLLDQLHPASLCPPLRNLPRQRLVAAPPRPPQSVRRRLRLARRTSSSLLRAPITLAEFFLDDLHSPVPDLPSNPTTRPGQGSAAPWQHPDRLAVRSHRLNQRPRLRAGPAFAVNDATRVWSSLTVCCSSVTRCCKMSASPFSCLVSAFA